MKRWNTVSLLSTLLVSVVLWALVAYACMCVGSNGGIGWPTGDFARHERRQLVLMASLVGAALAASGVVYQAILRNPLADPYLLGVSSGASLTSYLWHFPIFSFVANPMLAAVSRQAFAFAGALAAVAIVMTLATNRGRLEPVTLLLVGVIVNAINGAIFILINALRPELVAGIGGPLGFLIGGMQTSLTSGQRWFAAGCIGAGWLVLLSLSGALNAAVLGEAEAQSLGVRIHRLRWIALLVASVVTAAAVAVSGPIGFVGLICPHLTRLVVGTDQRRLLPVATALGAALLAVADAASRLFSNQNLAQTLIPVGVLTALMGGPFFLFLLWRQRREPARTSA